ncbi:unnamed protein product [Echinostoma caproni]|uniref:DNA replication complex GINS protein SLD5 n=1 Tax=Echinostoma caproni TaxID=27848 RepID=A0A3P8IF87_9TREM|nr:unnamed protein product [Echinostoma caproni]
MLSAHPDLLGLVQSETDRLNVEAKTFPPGDLRAQIKRMQAERVRFILTDYMRIRIQKIERFAEHILAEERARPDSESPHLTAEEFLFAKAYTNSIKEYLKNVIVNRLPANMQAVKDEDLGQLSLASYLAPRRIDVDGTTYLRHNTSFFNKISLFSYTDVLISLHPPTPRFALIAFHPSEDSYVLCRAQARVDAVQVSDYTGADSQSSIVSLSLEPGEQHLLPFSSVRSYVESGDVVLL